MKINIATEVAPGWVLRWISESYASRMPNTVVSEKADPEADVNVYINYPLLTEKTQCDIAYFTHKELTGDLVQIFEETAVKADWCIAMCQRTAHLLPSEKTTVLLIPPDPQYMKEEITFGVVGREYSSGRKRIEWIEKLSTIPGIKIKFTNNQLTKEEMPEFYNSIDYLLILSNNEGGPLPLVEALAMGKPVISSNVGFDDEYTTLKYSSYDELEQLIKRLVIPKDAWDIAARDMYKLCERVWKEKQQN